MHKTPSVRFCSSPIAYSERAALATNKKEKKAGHSLAAFVRLLRKQSAQPTNYLLLEEVEPSAVEPVAGHWPVFWQTPLEASGSASSFRTG